MGRPSKRTPELIDEICERLCMGEPLAAICRDEHMPHRSTVSDWAASDEEVSRRIARAREEGEEFIAEECLRIADTPMLGVIEKVEPVVVVEAEGDQPAVIEERLVERKTEDMLGHRKLQIETRLKLLAKWNPKKWGERVAVDHGVQDNLADQLRAARERAGIG